MYDPNSRALMSIIDGLPKPWRALVHEYGFKAVMQCREEGNSLEDAEDALWMQRSSRQAQWLSTNYITQRSFANV